MLRYEKEFEEIFNVPIQKFTDKMIYAFTGARTLDIIKFDDYMVSKGYDIKKDGSLKMYLTKTYSQKASDLIESILKIKIKKGGINNESKINKRFRVI